MRALVRLAASAGFATVAALGVCRADAAVVDAHNFDGQSDSSINPADTALAVGPTRMIEVVNRKYAIYPRAAVNTTAPIATGAINDFGGHASTVQSSDPQIVWDPSSRRFYFVMTSVFPDGTALISYGWSRSDSPNSAADFCRSSVQISGDIPNRPRVGATRDYILLTSATFRKSDGEHDFSWLFVYTKPTPGTECDGVKAVTYTNLYVPVSGSAPIPAPSPIVAVPVDGWARGFIVARNPTLPSNKLWLFGVRPDASGGAVFDSPVSLALPFSYNAPPDATQPGSTSPKLDTGDASFTQAVVARNPARHNRFSLWTQHTVKNGKVSAVRWYEIDPVANPPQHLRSGLIGAPDTFTFNAAIAPDRAVDETSSAFGDSFVINYNRVSKTKNVFPQIRVASSYKGGNLLVDTVIDSGHSYVGSACLGAAAVCPWGYYAGAAPDPLSVSAGQGLVWGANAYAGAQSRNPANWRSRIFATSGARQCSKFWAVHFRPIPLSSHRGCTRGVWLARV